MSNDDEFLARDILRYGAYVCVRPTSSAAVHGIAAIPIPVLADRLGFQNEFDPERASPASDSIAFLRRHRALGATIADDDVAEAAWVIHVAANSPEPVAEFCSEAQRLLDPLTRTRVLSGVVHPRNYTSAAMSNWAYERAVAQQAGTIMPNAFLIPMSKTQEWWRKDWMERHTYFLPRYDDHGRMVAEGHALAAEAGIACLFRRSYHVLHTPAPPGSYDFITYFECSDADVPVFESVCARLRDVKQNPEWQFVREGPTWQGRRLERWQDLFAA